MTARPAPTQYGDRAVYPVSEFNRGVAGWVDRLPRVWVEGEVSELKRNDRWALAYLTLKDLSDVMGRRSCARGWQPKGCTTRRASGRCRFSRGRAG